MLLQTFSCFMIIDRYEIMIELIKRELKATHNEAMEASPKQKKLRWVLSKFMIALDIHFYLKHGSIKGAIQSMFDFLATFGKYLNQVEAVKVLSFAFYLTLLGRFG
jgi:hypothetical protein